MLMCPRCARRIEEFDAGSDLDKNMAVAPILTAVYGATGNLLWFRCPECLAKFISVGGTAVEKGSYIHG